MIKKSTATKEEVLKKYFGYDEFREGQARLIEQIIAGRDVLGIMPTGAGKSLCFQVPALILPGITLVISPLISLMRDQVQALRANGVEAAYVNSSLTWSQTKKVLENCKKGQYKLIYVAPERLEMPEFVEFALAAQISLLTIDEAHCVSQWGQNFRPSYVRIAEFVNCLNKRPVISAFTATATGEVRADVEQLLGLDQPLVIVTGFNRPNLKLIVQQPQDKKKELLTYVDSRDINKHKLSGIIYCNTRKATEEVAMFLQKAGYAAAYYHAGIADKERSQVQEDFINDRINLIVATNAFGMGIDKSNVSFVVHYNMPKDLESYYQEAGRAGRDGTEADCILFYAGQDVVTNQFIIDNNQDRGELSDTQLMALKAKERERLKLMTFYCHSKDCLREYILEYFGEHPLNFCGNCSSCNSNFTEVDVLEDAQKILSCVVRTKQRYGLKMIIDTLRGSQAEKIVRLGLTKSISWGQLTKISEKKVRDVCNFLLVNGYMELTNSQYPVAQITEMGKRLLLGEQDELKMKQLKVKSIFQRPMDRLAPGGLTKVESQTAARDSSLLVRLKQLRLQLAREQKVPAFVIFSDATLHDMCRKMPKNEQQFLEVSGVGNRKLAAYGEKFLAEIQK